MMFGADGSMAVQSAYTSIYEAIGFPYALTTAFAVGLFHIETMAKRSSNGKIISWYSIKDAYCQHNYADETYHYVAIG